MTCERCAERREKLREAVLRGKLDEAVRQTIAGIKDMVGKAIPVDITGFHSGGILPKSDSPFALNDGREYVLTNEQGKKYGLDRNRYPEVGSGDERAADGDGKDRRANARSGNGTDNSRGRKSAD